MSGVVEKIDILEEEVSKHHDRINEMRSIQIDALGRSGKNGRLGRLESDVRKLERKLDQEVKDMRNDIRTLQEFRWKLAGSLAVVVLLSNVIAAVLLHLY